VALIALVGSAARAVAADEPPADYSYDAPAGLFCEFPLRYEGWCTRSDCSSSQVSKEFFDRNGVRVRALAAGKGDALRFTNLDTGESLWLKPNGAVNHTTFNADGTSTVTLTGHFVVILFSTDVPAGPSTTLYVGQVVISIHQDGVWELLSTSGRSTDICAALQ
jgi:hypothetical protein